MAKSLDALSERELSEIVTKYGSSKEATETIYTWRALEALLKKNPRLSLELFAKTTGLEGGAGIEFFKSAVESNESVVVAWLSTARLADSRFVIRPAMIALGKKSHCR